MNDPRISEAFADPTTQPFWDACRDRRFLIQRCSDCGHHQFYPRPLCLSCESSNVGWIEAKGTGTVYSVTTVRVPVIDELPPPYPLAVVDLDEGVRYLANIVGGEAAIGERVRLDWRERGDLPPLPVFQPLSESRTSTTDLQDRRHE